VSKKHVAVLMGGFSSERAVSLASGKACANALKEEYAVTCVDVDNDLALVLYDLAPDVVFNALHGSYGEDGTVQGILEYLQIPYTHSGVLASALCMDKRQAKIIASAADIPVADSKILNRFNIVTHPFEPPYIVKPMREGSSCGVCVIQDKDDVSCIEKKISLDWKYGDDILVEPYIAGCDLSCAVIGDRVLDVCEILLEEGPSFYDYDSKYIFGASRHVCPANLKKTLYKKIQTISLKAHKVLGCRGVSRSDFRYDKATGNLVWLEINTQPGMTFTSILPDIARVSGYSFLDLVRWIVEDASCLR
jgi:D-alanine-D-alanine ligase